MTSSNGGTGHLAYYEKHNISPVHYKAANLDEHFDRRDALYRALGLPPIAFSGVRAIEVAAGSGQNSLYVASCRPQTFDLVEPNPAGRQDIEDTYGKMNRPYTKPTIHPLRLEDFNPTTQFDIVICENWLGWQKNELALLRKLGSFVAPGGVLVTTIVPLSGVFANTMRRLFMLRLAKPGSAFAEQTKLAVDVFGPHLSTMVNMTRSHEDWVHDCVMNPHFLNVALPLDMVLNEIGSDLHMLATFPRFETDWRWFKALTRDSWAFNERFLRSYRANILNFVDHTKNFGLTDDPAIADALDAAFLGLQHAALAYQQKLETDGVAACEGVTAALEKISDRLIPLATVFEPVLDELKTAWSSSALSPSDVRNMKQFGAMFGRELVYASLTRPRTAMGQA